MSPRLGRRALVLGGSAALVSACASGTTERPDPPGVLEDGSWRSSAMRGARVGWGIAYPPGTRAGDHLPVVVTLHGRGASHTTAFATLHLDQVLAEIVASGVPAFALASVDGGDDGYWHPRADGTDPGAMVVDEFVPLLRQRGLDTGRLGLHGWSMGAYGALLLAGRGRLPVRALAVASPALFASPGATPQGAFDDASDFEANDVLDHPEWLDGIPLRVDCGRDDPFYATTRRFVEGLHERPAGGFEPGAHTIAYWRSMAPAQLRFLGHRV